MAELSVNISQRERAQIKRVAQERFYKSAKNRHPDPDFREKITIQIYMDSLENLRPMIEADTLKYVEHVNRVGQGIRMYDLPEDYAILELEDSQDFLEKKEELCTFDMEKVVIPSEFKSPDGRYPLCLGAYSNSVGKIDISDYVKKEIFDHNNKMTEIYSQMSAQWKHVKNLIDTCKTTKSFNLHLPQLTALYPRSVIDKLEKKNRVEEHELTEEEQMVADAAKTIAASALFDDD